MYIKLLVGTSHLLFFRETDCFFFCFFFTEGRGLTYIFNVLGKLID